MNNTKDNFHTLLDNYREVWNRFEAVNPHNYPDSMFWDDGFIRLVGGQFWVDYIKAWDLFSGANPNQVSVEVLEKIYRSSVEKKE